ncbi:hypothetical protein ACFWAT_11800 [Streptomyces syringium]|uniref:hypothetical protein n=1 Tax=Streptomyces syringium TaxID=76729 RepID=UPI003669B0D2
MRAWTKRFLPGQGAGDGLGVLPSSASALRTGSRSVAGEPKLGSWHRQRRDDVANETERSSVVVLNEARGLPHMLIRQQAADVPGQRQHRLVVTEAAPFRFTSLSFELARVATFFAPSDRCAA